MEAWEGKKSARYLHPLHRRLRQTLHHVNEMHHPPPYVLTYSLTDLPLTTSTRRIIRRLTYVRTYLLTYPSPHQRDASSAALRTYLLTYSYPSLRQRGASSAALRTYFLTYLLTELRARGTCIPCTVAFARTFIAPLKPIICSAMEFPATSMECRACRFERSALALDLERRPVSTSMSSSRSRRTSRRV